MPRAIILPFMEPIHILGAGSIGMYWASSIRSAFPSYPLAALLRPHHKARFLPNVDSSSRRPEVMVCTMQNRRPRMASVPIEFIGDDRRTPIKNLILATKAHQAENALIGIFPRLKMAPASKDPLRIFILSNGALDIRENLRELFRLNSDLPAVEYIMCTTTEGVVREQDNFPLGEHDEPMIHLNHIRRGSTFLGGVPGMAQIWDQSGLNATAIGCDEESSVSPDPMEVFLWKKLAGNCFCDPLTALWGVTNGELLHHEEASRMRRQVVKEVSAVAQELHPGWPETDLSETALGVFVEKAIQDTLDNRSSMYYDLEQRRKTEVESLNGYIVRRAKLLGIETPANEALLRQVQDREKKQVKTS